VCRSEFRSNAHILIEQPEAVCGVQEAATAENRQSLVPLDHTDVLTTQPEAFSMCLTDQNVHAALRDKIESCANPVAESSVSAPIFFDSEPTRTGRRRKCRDMSELSLCLCGVNAEPGDIGSVQCQRQGCETIWVSSLIVTMSILFADRY
jgi:hypothetical protein